MVRLVQQRLSELRELYEGVMTVLRSVAVHDVENDLTGKAMTGRW